MAKASQNRIIRFQLLICWCVLERTNNSQACWHASVIPAVRRLAQDNCKFEASLNYTLRLYLIKKREKKNKEGCWTGSSGKAPA
jgi:hypothetical protein